MAEELILVVDDDPDIVELLRCVLHDAGWRRRCCYVVWLRRGAWHLLPSRTRL
jgi:CheY-like chemotaxis protein